MSLVIKVILMKDIIREGNNILRNISCEVEIPPTAEDKKLLIDMIGYLFNSQNEEKCKELNLRPGVGIAAPQVGVNKRMFAIFTTDLDNKLWLLPVINPKITKKSKEMIFLPTGEGCLSVDRATTGITPRHQKITVEGYFYNVKTDRFDFKKMELKDYIAIVFQHEFDHLDGILYVDKLLDKQEAIKKGYKPLWDDEE